MVNMPLTLSQKIIKSHLVSGEMIEGHDIGIRIDQTLTQDATGTMAYLEFESMGIPRVKTEKSVAYVDHNTLQTGFENADDHKFIASIAKKHGIYFSRPGNGICHQVHLERFSSPGKTLIGSDSHTPTCGGIGMLAIGAGGLDVAVAMGGGEYHITMPKITCVHISNKMPKNVSAKDIILYILSEIGVKGGIGKIFEYCGNGIENLSVPERATITNMGAELGATTSIFPSDKITKKFLESQNRSQDFIELYPDKDAQYDEHIYIDLSKLKPLVACPHSPDNIKTVSSIAGMPIDQICFGSCTNSSYLDLMKVAKILKGKTVHPNISVSLSPGSKQVYNMLAQNGALADLIDSGVRILECACGPCIGMGQSPNTNGISLRTFNRNFEGRSGTHSGQVYLVSPETAAISAIYGVLTEPKEEDCSYNIVLPNRFHINDNMIVPPANESDYDNIKIFRGPNIKSIPIGKALDEKLSATVNLKVGDNITTDHIMPAGAKILPYRSNIPYLSNFCFYSIDEQFNQRCKKRSPSVIIAGSNYGQGSSREHAALVPLYLGVRVVIAKSFARIHAANLVNAGILPLEFITESDYNLINVNDSLLFLNLDTDLIEKKSIKVKNLSNDITFTTNVTLSDRQIKIILAGGLLNFTKN